MDEISSPTGRVHFVGIGGSGISAVAAIAHALGFDITGCDASADSPYLSPALKEAVRISPEHSTEHLLESDLLVASRTMIMEGGYVEETRIAAERGVIVPWQQFLNEHVVRSQYLICVAGTHGKTTTTALVGELLRDTEFDPTVVVGGVVPSWGANHRVGRSPTIVVEADEYHDNFRYYSPHLLIWNNADFEHPDYYRNEDEYLAAFSRLIRRMKPRGTLVCNLDAENVAAMVKNHVRVARSDLKILGYGAGSRPDWLPAECYSQFVKTRRDISIFRGNDTIRCDTVLAGIHNGYNLTAAITACLELTELAHGTISRLAAFSGADRRIQVTAIGKRFVVLDDYAHHPAEVRATLLGVKERFPGHEVIAILEIHQISRAIAFLADFDCALSEAARVYIMPIFEVGDPGLVSIGPDILAGRLSHPFASAYSDGTIAEVAAIVGEGGVAVVTLGAGRSAAVNRQLVAYLESTGCS